jgi:signal peptidase I
MAEGKVKKVIKEWVESIVIALLCALFIRTFVVEAFKIPSGSMKPTLEVGDRIFVNKFIYKFKEPQRGDIVVFRYPEDPKRYFIKRLAAKGGEEVEIREGNLIINGKVVKYPEIFQKIYYYNRGKYGAVGKKVKVPPGYYYFLGDNSAFSKDSRFWGFVPREYIVGKAFFRFWPLWRIGLIH